MGSCLLYIWGTFTVTCFLLSLALFVALRLSSLGVTFLLSSFNFIFLIFLIILHSLKERSSHPADRASNAYQPNKSRGYQKEMAVARTKATSKIRRIGKKRGATLRDVHPWRWVKICSQHFKQEGKIMVPNCTEIVKTSHGRERAPQNPDWYYIRCAAVLRAVYLRPGVGYGGLSKRFASKKNRGSRPEITTRASRGLLHWCCKSLRELGLIEKCTTSGHCVTSLGRKVSDTIAFKVAIRKMNLAKAS